MPAIRFPRATTPAKYYQIHPKYLLDIFKHLGYTIEFIGDSTVGMCTYAVWIDGVKILFDCWDLLPTGEYPEPCFKFHFSEGVHQRTGKLFPFSPVSFYDWPQYYSLSNSISYRGDGQVLSMQRPYCGAKERRIKLQGLLKARYGSQAITTLMSQSAYWGMINQALVHVFAPGARNDMLDRGQAQYMGFGCCTISPRLITVLPYWKKIEPGVHYVECRPDYSDVVEKVEWCRRNREACIQIGQNAKTLFRETSTPEALIEWVKACLKS